MKRRDVIKNIGFVTGGILLFPSCNFSNEKVTIAMNRLKVTEDNMALLKTLVNVILPDGDMPGGIALNIDKFIWVIVDDCISTDYQKSFLNGIEQFDQEVKIQIGQSFNSLNSFGKEKAVQELLENKNTKTEVQYFINTTKQVAVWGYMNSEYYKTKQMPYKLVPGPFSYQTCKTIDTNEKININA